MLDVGFQRVQSVRSWLPEVECVICEISDCTISFLVPRCWMCQMWVFRGYRKFHGSLMLDVLDVGFQRTQ